MKWLRKFLKLRKQNDYVKIMSVIFFTGMFMLGSVAYNGVNVYQKLHTPTEYVLNAEPDKMTNEALENLIKTEGISRASTQKQLELTIGNSEEKVSFVCYQITKAYLRDVYQGNETGGMKTFYLTPKAYRKTVLEFENEKNNNKEFQAKYEKGEEESGMAKFVLLESTLFEEEEVVFCEGSSSDFLKDCNEIRAYITKRDLDGTLIRHIENMGYSIENREIVQKTEYELERSFLKIKYETVIAILCLGFVIILNSLMKKHNLLTIG
ncbi:MAG: hypothetical protein ACLRZ9_07310 [Eubacterium sp.]